MNNTVRNSAMTNSLSPANLLARSTAFARALIAAALPTLAVLSRAFRYRRRGLLPSVRLFPTRRERGS